MPQTAPYLNLGCGNRFHPDWINIDIVSTHPSVIAHDLSKGIPLADNSCQVVYHSHVLEHIRQVDAKLFISDCYRVLNPGGIIRVAVPDLEQIAQIYLTKLEEVLAGKITSRADYEWMLLEMYDQTVREQSGGQMCSYLRQSHLPNEAFVYQRIGEEGRNLIELLRQPPPGRQIILRNLPRYLPRLLNKIRDNWIVPLLLGKEGTKALKIGQFRLSGEVHQWMYDRYSLAQLLISAGFQKPIQQSATNSLIDNWTSFNLDTNPEGTINKLDSLYMESIK